MTLHPDDSFSSLFSIQNTLIQLHKHTPVETTIFAQTHLHTYIHTLAHAHTYNSLNVPTKAYNLITVYICIFAEYYSDSNIHCCTQRWDPFFTYLYHAHKQIHVHTLHKYSAYLHNEHLVILLHWYCREWHNKNSTMYIRSCSNEHRLLPIKIIGIMAQNFSSRPTAHICVNVKNLRYVIFFFFIP